MTAAEAEEHVAQVRGFIDGTSAAARGVIPICAQLGHNLGAVCAQIASLPSVPRDTDAAARMLIVRSFDVNRPGAAAAALKGGVLGGAITQGVLRLGQEVEIRPGILARDAQGSLSCKPCAHARQSNTLRPSPMADIRTRLPSPTPDI